MTSSLQDEVPPTHASLIIIGSGPAGHTAAIYAARAGIQTTLYEGYMALGTAAGGQLTTTDDVENFPGFLSIKGGALMEVMREQSKHSGAQVIPRTVASVDFSKRPFQYQLYPEYCSDTDGYDPLPDIYTADSVIIATGAKARRLNLPGEEEFWNRGVSACAVCDGGAPIFRNQPIAVIGGGDSACEEATFLSKKGSKVYVLVRRDKMRASNANVRRISKIPNVEVLYNTQATEILGQNENMRESGVVGLTTKTRMPDGTEKVSRLDVRGLFYAVGHDPATALFKGQVEMDEDGYIITKPGGLTSVEGVFAAGDVQDKLYRQAITSAGTGCMTAFEAEKYLQKLEDEEAEKERNTTGHITAVETKKLADEVLGEDTGVPAEIVKNPSGDVKI